MGTGKMRTPNATEKIPEKVLQCNDCRNFFSLDVAKGICRLTQDVVLTDSKTCTDYVQLPKCKFCTYFSTGHQEGIGMCNAEADHPWAYPEMIAVTCAMFK